MRRDDARVFFRDAKRWGDVRIARVEVVGEIARIVDRCGVAK